MSNSTQKKTQHINLKNEQHQKRGVMKEKYTLFQTVPINILL